MPGGRTTPPKTFSCGLLSPFSSRPESHAVAFSFEKLLVYQKAIDFADRVCTHSERFPRGYGFLVDQLNRAALSIAANIEDKLECGGYAWST